MTVRRRELLAALATGTLAGWQTHASAARWFFPNGSVPKGDPAAAFLRAPLTDAVGEQTADTSTPPSPQPETFVRDYGAIGDGTLHTVAEWLDPTSPTQIKYKSLAALRADYPHVTSARDSIDWAAIQKAINTGRNVGFHDGRYMLGGNQLVSTAVAQGFYGLNSNLGANLGDPASKGAIIMWTPTKTSNPAWIAQNSHQRFSGLKFWGDATSKDNVAVTGRKSTNTDDMDIYFLNCEFYQCYQSIYCYGRGLMVDRCLFSQIKGGDAITNDWQSSGAVGSQAQTDDQIKGRALRITNNRVHGTGTLLVIRNFKARSAMVDSNLLDLGNRLMRVDNAGGWLDGAMTGNVADACGMTVIQFDPGTSCVGLNITGGSLGGASSGTIDGADKRPNAILAFDGCTEIDGVSLTGVNMHDTDGYILQFNNSTRAKAITPRNISIKGGQISGFGQRKSGACALIATTYDIEGLSIDPGSIAQPGPSVNALVQSTGAKTINGLFLGGAIGRSDVATFANVKLAGVVDGVERLKAGGFRRYRSSATLFEQTGTGSPEGLVTADPGSTFISKSGATDATTYIKKAGAGTSNGWFRP